MLVYSQYLQNILSITRKKKDKHDQIVLLVKSKLNSKENMTSKAVIHFPISYEDSALISNEADKYLRLKQDIRMMKVKKVIKTVSR